MAKLTAKKRNSLKSSAFAEPGKRAYPINDASHARNALSRVSQFGSSAEKAQVRSAVHAKYPSMGQMADMRSGVPPCTMPGCTKRHLQHPGA